MGWYQEPSTTIRWRRRVPITVVTTNTDTSRNVTVEIPEGWDDFWTAIDTDGFSLRVTTADGVTKATYNATIVKSARFGSLDIGSVGLPGVADRAVLLWLYYMPTDTADDSSGSPSISSQLTGRIDLGRPDPQWIRRIRPNPPGQTVPDATVSKATTGSTFVWLDFTDVLQPARSGYYGRTRWEEPAVGSAIVYDDTGTADATMTTPADMRWVAWSDGGAERIYLKMRLKAGSDGDKATIEGGIQTVTPLDAVPYRLIVDRIAVRVRNALLT